jgi:hypothetical protein
VKDAINVERNKDVASNLNVKRKIQEIERIHSEFNIVNNEKIAGYQIYRTLFIRVSTFGTTRLRGVTAGGFIFLA